MDVRGAFLVILLLLCHGDRGQAAKLKAKKKSHAPSHVPTTAVPTTPTPTHIPTPVPTPAPTLPPALLQKWPETLHGVNFGGWLVPERRVTPSLFKNVEGDDMAALAKGLAGAMQQKMDEHRGRFISEMDFDWLYKQRVHHVRVPFGFWDVVDTAGYPTGGMDYMKKALDWAELYHMRLLLDLHAAPGSQNGLPSSGRTGKIEWYKKANIDLSLHVIETVAQAFGNHSALYGINLLNAPDLSDGSPIAMGGNAVLKHYYTEAYHRVRRHTVTIKVVFDDGGLAYSFDDFMICVPKLLQPAPLQQLAPATTAVGLTSAISNVEKEVEKDGVEATVEREGKVVEEEGKRFLVEHGLAANRSASPTRPKPPAMNNTIGMTESPTRAPSGKPSATPTTPTPTTAAPTVPPCEFYEVVQDFQLYPAIPKPKWKDATMTDYYMAFAHKVKYARHVQSQRSLMCGSFSFDIPAQLTDKLNYSKAEMKVIQDEWREQQLSMTDRIFDALYFWTYKSEDDAISFQHFMAHKSWPVPKTPSVWSVVDKLPIVGRRDSSLGVLIFAILGIAFMLFCCGGK